MKNPDDRTILYQFKALSRIEPDEAAARLALEHARAVARSLSAGTVSELKRVQIRNRLSLTFEGLTMRQRIAALGGVGVAALLGFLLLWGGIGTKPLSAMEKMAESIRKARSYKCSSIATYPSSVEPGNPARNQEVTGTEYWLASGSTRFECKHRAALAGKKPLESADYISICSARDRSWICINSRTKSFSRHTTNPQVDSHLERLDLFGKFSGQADRELGIKDLNGKTDSRVSNRCREA